MANKKSSRCVAACLSTIVLVLALLPARAFAGTPDDAERSRIEKINREIREKGLHWTAGTTSVSNLTAAEKRALCGAIRMQPGAARDLPIIQAPAGATYEPVFDWRAHGGTTPAKDQRGCGSCWAFASVGQLESHIRIFDDRIEDLSEAQTLFCNPYGSGCGGGTSYAAYAVMQTYGQVRESCIPYEDLDNDACTQEECEPVAWIASYAEVANDVNSIKQALLTGPVYTTYDVTDRFYDYQAGCFSEQQPVVGYHAMLIVGWDDTKCGGDGAWIVKNSWGVGWGMDGFAYIQYGTNNIGWGTMQISYIPSTVYVRVDDPNGGEELEAGEEYPLVWTTSRVTPDSVSILLSLDGGDSYEYTIARGLIGVSSYTWEVADLPVTTARIRVLAWHGGEIGGYDESDGDFTISGKPYRYVSTTGGNIYPYSTPSWAALSIQDAVDAAAPGDSIMVSEGTYAEAVEIHNAVHLMGGWNTTFTARDPEALTTTISHFGSPVSFVTIASGMPGIEGFVILGGTGTFAIIPMNGIYGGGILTYDSDALIKDNVFTDCGYTDATQFSAGGAIACYNGSVTITGNTISGCRAQTGGGIYLYLADADITGNSISGSMPNPEFSGTKNGGGIFALHSAVTMSGNVIDSCSGYGNGGGVCAVLSTLSADGDSILSNTCLMNGGGIFSERSPLSIEHAVVLHNYAASMGGGICHKAAVFGMENSILALNDAGAVAGGIYADSCWGEWTNNTFDRNSGLYAGGNVFLSRAVSCVVTNNLITHGTPSGFHSVPADNIAFRFNDCFGNLAGDVVELVPDSTNFSRSPHYADTAACDYQLALHSGGIDTGDPSIVDTDGSGSDVGAFGGPGAATAAPEYVRGLSAAALGDSSIALIWEDRFAGEFDYYAVYSDTAEGFVPDISNFVGIVEASSQTFVHSPVSGCRYYRVNIVDNAGYAGGYSNEDGACIEGTTTGTQETPPPVNALGQNFPNPFNGTTTVTYSLAAAAHVTVKIYDTAGRLVRTLENADKAAGSHKIIWNGEDDSSRGAASGVYFIRLVAGDFDQTRKIIYLK